LSLAGIWKKKESRDNESLLLNIIDKFGPLRYLELLQKFNEFAKTSNPTLSKHLKGLEAKGQIEKYYDENKRADCYRIKFEKKEYVDYQLRRYEATKFLESMEDLFVIRHLGKDGKSSVNLFFSPLKKEDEEQIANVLRLYAKSWEPILNKALRVPKPKYKLAVILTKEE
jgi:DNA-binding MarR family transcriptional regulator